MKKIFVLCISFFLYFSCASSGDYSSPSDTAANKQPSFATVQTDLTGEQGTAIRVDNPTSYNVYFERNQRVDKNSSGTVTLLIESGTLSGGFDIWYEIPISSTVPLFCKGDHRTIRDNQTSLTINEPRITENYGTFLSIKNNGGNAIRFSTGGTINALVEQTGSPAAGNSLRYTDKREFSPGETAVFDIGGDSGAGNYFIQDNRINIPFVMPQPLERNYLYTFEYGAKGMELTDSRPLHRVGEAGWAKEMPDTEMPGVYAPMLLIVDGEEIQVFVPAENGLFRRGYDSAGNSKAQVRSGDGFEATFAARSGDGFFIAGYEIGGTPNVPKNVPVARVHGADGTLRSLLSPSAQPEYDSAFFNTAAQKDDGWLVAGGARGANVAGDEFPAYVRLIKNNAAALAADWELGRADFDAAVQSGPKCGEVRCVVYDPGAERWLLSGKNLEWNNVGALVTGSYLAVISGGGNIQKIDTSFNDMSFYKIVLDTNGDYYLIGEEQKGSESFALIIKYDTEGRLLWRLPAQPPSHSFYEDAILDSENRQIVLGGTLRAEDGGGNGGIPFIEALDPDNGTLLWREELSDPGFARASLVTAIAMAPDYGFALTLSGIDNGYPSQPYVVARLNARGKFFIP